MNLYGRFFQMAGDLRRWRVHTLTDHFVFSFQARLFIAGNKQGVVRGFEIQGKVNRKNNCSVFVLGGGHLTLEDNGSDIILSCLQASWDTKVELLIVSWSQGGSYLQFLEQKLLRALITKLISYYSLKLKFSNS